MKTIIAMANKIIEPHLNKINSTLTPWNQLLYINLIYFESSYVVANHLCYTDLRYQHIIVAGDNIQNTIVRGKLVTERLIIPVITGVTQTL